MKKKKKKGEDLVIKIKFPNLIVHMNIYFNEAPEPQTYWMSSFAHEILGKNQYYTIRLFIKFRWPLQ